ncbi:MAG: hypothetical protein DPW09_02065 [Anaerolineae bacterium]|nr:hypothetical protein [Anaerolineae bacterium]MCQ3972214.1 hypothetical protein [Anaerolineae bacterium]
MATNLEHVQNDGDILNQSDAEKLEAGLVAALYRQDCPAVIELGEYQLGLVNEATATRLAAHLERCPHCQAELARLADFLAEDASLAAPAAPGEETSWQQGEGFRWRQLKETGQLVIQIVGEALDKASRYVSQGPPRLADQLAYGGLRSEDPARSLGQLALTKEVEDLEVIITAETMRRQADQCAITVHVNIPSRGGWPNLAGTAVTLKRDEVKLTTHTTNAHGQTVFEGIPTAEFAHLSFEIIPANVQGSA